MITIIDNKKVWTMTMGREGARTSSLGKDGRGIPTGSTHICRWRIIVKTLATIQIADFTNQVMWDDLIGEPEGVRSLDCTWNCSKTCFQVRNHNWVETKTKTDNLIYWPWVQLCETKLRMCSAALTWSTICKINFFLLIIYLLCWEICQKLLILNECQIFAKTVLDWNNFRILFVVLSSKSKPNTSKGIFLQLKCLTD